MALAFDYYDLRLGRDRAAQRTLASQLQAAAAPPLAVFAPLLGFPSNALLVLNRGGEGTDPRQGAGVASGEHHRLTPTLRPTAATPPQPGGVYVHNWFTIDGTAVDEFVRLSGEAWPDFEARFETKIHGLFLAEETAADRADGARRLLLMTRYRDLGEWQVSRDPTTDAMAVFLRRRELTRASLARACLVMPSA
jgi:hypothetical protein